MDSAGAEEPSRVSMAAGLTSVSFVLSEGHECREAPLGGHGAGWIGLGPSTPHPWGCGRPRRTMTESNLQLSV